MNLKKAVLKKDDSKRTSLMKRYAQPFALLITAPGFLDEVEKDLHEPSKEFYLKHKDRIASITDNWQKKDVRILAMKLQGFLLDVVWSE
ncbi:MAG: hypothetical protein KQH63_18490 [Desulfobulbaceae bacterium]|nr:hypothetical protein [Desulfobulbaceae bacterium]